MITIDFILGLVLGVILGIVVTLLLITYGIKKRFDKFKPWLNWRKTESRQRGLSQRPTVKAIIDKST